MKKKKQKKQIDEIGNLVNRLIKQAKNKYQRYGQYLSDEFYQRLSNHLIQLESLSSSAYQEEIDHFVYHELCHLVIDGNIDLEIEIIEENLSKIVFLMKKMGINGPNINKMAETYIMNAIQSYKGDLLFSLYIIQCIKKDMSSHIKKSPVKVKNEIDKPTIDHSQEKEQKVIPLTNQMMNKNQSMDDLISKYVASTNVEIIQPTFLEELFQSVVVFSDKEQLDSNFLKFAYLKYGYYQGIYFGFDDISNILKLDHNDLFSYYIQSLTLLKESVQQTFSQYKKNGFIYQKK